jgi:hypothetical protein
MKTKKTVIVTGASGLIAGYLLPYFKDRYELTLLDVKDTNREGNRIQGIHIVDLVDKDLDTYRDFFRGADAIVHFGWVHCDNPKNQFRNEMCNVQMAYNVYQTAMEENVRRVVMASSNHAADYYESLILDGKMDLVTPDTKPLSHGYYGWAKETYEHLGFVFALGRQNNRSLENVQIRIGGPRGTDLERCDRGDLRRVRRALAAYLSKRDMAQLFIKSIETKDIRDKNGVPFQIFYGISNNPHGFWSIANAREIIGYDPEDNSEIRFRQLINEHIQAAEKNKQR